MATGGGGGSEMGGGSASEMAVGVGEENPSPSTIPTRGFFVALHVGAGFHAPANEKAYRRAMKRACLAAAAVLREVLSSSSNPLTPTLSFSLLIAIWFGMAWRLDFTR